MDVGEHACDPKHGQKYRQCDGQYATFQGFSSFAWLSLALRGSAGELDDAGTQAIAAQAPRGRDQPLGEEAVDAEVWALAVIGRVQPVRSTDAGQTVAGDYERGEAQQGVADIGAGAADRGVDREIDGGLVVVVVLQRRLAIRRYGRAGASPVAAVVDVHRAASRVVRPAEVAGSILARRLVGRAS